MNEITMETRRESNLKTDRGTRYNMILSVLEPGVELTAREIKDVLGFDDMDAVRPRLTELCQKGVLETVPDKKKYEPSTDRRVAVYRRITC